MRVQERPLSVDLNRPPDLSGSWLLLLWVAPQMANHLQHRFLRIQGPLHLHHTLQVDGKEL